MRLQSPRETGRTGLGEGGRPGRDRLAASPRKRRWSRRPRGRGDRQRSSPSRLRRTWPLRLQASGFPAPAGQGGRM